MSGGFGSAVRQIGREQRWPLAAVSLPYRLPRMAACAGLAFEPGRLFSPQRPCDTAHTPLAAPSGLGSRWPSTLPHSPPAEVAEAPSPASCPPRQRNTRSGRPTRTLREPQMGQQTPPKRRSLADLRCSCARAVPHAACVADPGVPLHYVHLQGCPRAARPACAQRHTPPRSQTQTCAPLPPQPRIPMHVQRHAPQAAPHCS